MQNKVETFLVHMFIFLVAFSLHFLWENSHVSLYTGYENLSPILPITLWATIGDVFYTFLAVLIFSIVRKNIHWVHTAGSHDFLYLFFIGVMIALFVEYKALLFGRWQYLPEMPIIPVLNVGLTPVLQMAILLPITIFLSSRIVKLIRR